MSQDNIAPVTAADLSISGKEYFSSVPGGPFNAISAYMDLDDYEQLHIAIHKNKQCKAHWENNLRKYAHRAKPLFDFFTSVASLGFVFERKIDVPRDWELRLIFKDYFGKGQHKSLTHNESFVKVCQYGDLRIVRGMVERTQMNLEARGEFDSYDEFDTPLLRAARYGHLPVVQYLCEQGADKEAKDRCGHTPLHLAAAKGHLPVVQYLCEQGADKEARSEGGYTPLELSRDSRVVFYLCHPENWK